MASITTVIVPSTTVTAIVPSTTVSTTLTVPFSSTSPPASSVSASGSSTTSPSSSTFSSGITDSPPCLTIKLPGSSFGYCSMSTFPCACFMDSDGLLSSTSQTTRLPATTEPIHTTPIPAAVIEPASKGNYTVVNGPAYCSALLNSGGNNVRPNVSLQLAAVLMIVLIIVSSVASSAAPALAHQTTGVPILSVVDVIEAPNAHITALVRVAWSIFECRDRVGPDLQYQIQNGATGLGKKLYRVSRAV